MKQERKERAGKRVTLNIKRIQVVRAGDRADHVYLELDLKNPFPEGFTPCRARVDVPHGDGVSWALRSFGMDAEVLEHAVFWPRELSGMGRAELESRIHVLIEENETLRQGLDDAYRALKGKEAKNDD